MEIDEAIKLLEQLRGKIKNENPDYSEKEISAYISGMLRGLDMRKNCPECIKED